MWMPRALVVMLAIGAAATSSAQLVGPVHVLPVVAKIGGAQDTDWVSDVSISNLHTGIVVVAANFFRQGRSNSFTPGDVGHSEVLQGGATLLVEDVLGQWFPEEGDTSGFLVVYSLDLQTGISVSSRTYNAADPEATYGQSVGSTISSAILGPGRLVLPGLRQDARFRSNLGVLNIGAEPVDVEISLFDAGGAAVSSVVRGVGSLSLEQWSLTSLGAASLPGGGRAEVRLAASSLPEDPCQFTLDFGLPVGVISAYLSKVDNATGDAEFVLGQVDWSEYVAECGSAPDGC